MQYLLLPSGQSTNDIFTKWRMAQLSGCGYAGGYINLKPKFAYDIFTILGGKPDLPADNSVKIPDDGLRIADMEPGLNRPRQLLPIKLDFTLEGYQSGRVPPVAYRVQLRQVAAKKFEHGIFIEAQLSQRIDTRATFNRHAVARFVAADQPRPLFGKLEGSAKLFEVDDDQRELVK
jgi:hypothetical protein